MRLTAKNPEYEDNIDLWLKMHDAYNGQDAVKRKADVYLPKTTTMKTDIDYYNAYLKRAVFPEHVYRAVESFLGCLHREDPVITLPEKIKYMEDEATYYGENLKQVLREINFYQLLYSRFALAIDVRKDADGTARPYVVVYPPDKVTNWGVSEVSPDNLSESNIPSYVFIVINESGKHLNENGEWVDLTQHRVLKMINGIYNHGVFTNNDYDENQMIPLSTQNGTFNKIPFVFCNVKDLKPTVQRPMLLGLANLCFAIYMGDADYRQDLHRQSQDTLFTFGIPKPEAGLKIGAGAVVDAPLTARAEYVGVTGIGLQEQRVALDNLNSQALHDAGQFLSTPSKQSAEGISLFLTALNSGLNQVASTGADALKTILKLACEWVGVKDTSDLEIIPNTDFAESTISTKEVLDLWTTVQSGGLSPESYFNYLNRKGIIETSAEDELSLIEDSKEKIMLEASYGNPNGNQNAQENQTMQNGQTPVGNSTNANAVSKN